MVKCFVRSLIFCAISTSVMAQQVEQKPPQTADLTSMNIEDLMNVKVTSASKKAESLSDAPAAIFIVTGEDIRRGGYSSVPDALRQVPGMRVAQQSSHIWLVSARGYSNVFNNKMLVLIDGRLVYSPTFGGVWWDVQDPLLEDIDRIEVIRGPGGTLWGANAVNGVINIITKESAKTQGALVSTSAGVNEGYASRVRYGGKAGDNLTYRIYGTSNDWPPSVNVNGAENYDAWSLSQGGARIDWNVSQKDAVTFDGQGYSGRLRDVFSVFSPLLPPVQIDANFVLRGAHVLGRWKHTMNDRSTIDVLGYCDWTDRGDVTFGDGWNLCDLEFQHAYSFTERQSLTWGGTILTNGKNRQNTFTTGYVPLSRRDTTYSAFVQYDVMLVPGKFRVIAGSKFERNDYTGFEYQPQIRAVWTPKNAHTLWASISRAVRTPTFVETSLRVRLAQFSAAPPTFLLVTGSPNIDSEVLHAYELGYRYEWKQRFTVDAALYNNGYNNLVGYGALGAPIVNPAPFYVDLPTSFANFGNGQTRGLELYLTYRPMRRWTLSTGITELRGNSVAGSTTPATAGDPRQQVNVQSKFDLTQHLNFDAAYYYYDAIPFTLPPVNRVDVGLSTRPVRGFTFSVWGRNLQVNRHQEALGLIFPAGEIRRSVSFKLTWELDTDQGRGTH